VNALVLLNSRRGVQSPIQRGELLRFTGDGRTTDASIFDLYNTSLNIKKPSVMSNFGRIGNRSIENRKQKQKGN